MAKAIKFFYEYKDYYGDDHRVDIYVEGFAGAATELTPGAVPFSANVNKEVAEQFLGGICPTKFTLQALSTASFKSSSFLSQKYGDVSFVKKKGSVVEYQGVIEPFESMDLDEYEGNYFVQLGAECGLSYLKSIDFVGTDSLVQLRNIIKTCIDQIPNTENIGYNVIDNTLGYDSALNSTFWLDTYINDLQFDQKSYYEVLVEILRNTLEIFHGRSAWVVRNNYELAKGDSTIRIYDYLMALQTTTDNFRNTLAVDRLKGGNTTHQFSFKNVNISKPKSLSNTRLLDGGEFDSLISWAKVGGIGDKFTIADGRLYNNGNTVKNLASDGDYLESNPISFYPFQSLFSLVNNDVPKIELEFENNIGIEAVRIQVVVKQVLGFASTYYLTNEGSYYEQFAGITKTPIYFISGENKATIEIPRPPYRDSISNNLFPETDFGLFHPYNSILPQTNIEYQVIIRVFLPERIADTALNSGEGQDSYIDYIRVLFDRPNDEKFQGIEKEFGVATDGDRKNKLSIKSVLGYNTFPQGLETLYTDSNGTQPIVNYSRFGEVTKYNIDELIAYEHLEYLSVRRKKFNGQIWGDIDFSKIIEVDGVEYRFHNMSNDTRSRFANVQLLELSVDNVTPSVKKLDRSLTDPSRALNRNISFRDLNVFGKVDDHGMSFFEFSKDPIFDTSKLLQGEVFLVKEGNADSAVNFIDNDGNVTDYIKPVTGGFELQAEGNDVLQIKTDNLTTGYALQAPNLTAEATIATDATAWMRGATNVLTAKDFIGSASGNFDIGIKRNNVEVATIKSTGVDVVGRITAATAGFGTDNPLYTLDIIAPSAMYLRHTETPNTGGGTRLIGGNYSGNGVTGIFFNAIENNNQINIGGGTGLAEPATEINFFTGTYGTKSVGTLRLSISSSGVVNVSNLNASQLIATDASKNLVSLATETYPSLTELTYLKGVTSAIQTQINSKFATPSGLTTNYVSKWNGSSFVNSQIYDNGTNVGIGKSSPVSKLDVGGNGRFLSNIDVFTANGTVDGYIQLTNGTSSNSGYLQFRKPNNIRLGYIGFSSSNMNYVAENSASHAFIGGKVGIGTATPTDLLHVNGTTRTTNLKINSGAAVGKVWQCTNADGTGAWVSPLASERYIGEWDASSGTAPDATPTSGDYYVVSVSGTYLGITYAAGDEIYWDGTAWIRRQNFLTLPIATASVLGGVKIGDRISISSGVISADAQDWSIITGKPTTIEGYGITDYDSLWDARLATKSTTNLTEGTNLYYTDARARAAISSNASGLNYTNGELSFDSGYFLLFGDVNNEGHVLTIDYTADLGFTSEAKNTAYNKNFGTTAGTVAEGDHGHVIEDITSLSTVLDGKLNTPTLITNAVPYWDGTEFQNSFLRYGSGELSGEGKIILKEPSYSSPVITLENNFFGGTILFGGVSNAIIPTIDGFATLKLGYSNQKFKEINFSVTNYITLDSPIYEEITFQQEGFTRDLRGLRIDEFDVSKIGTDIDTGTFSILLGSYDDAGNRRSRDWENIISPSDGRWYKIEADGSVKKYLLEGEVSTGGGGTYEIPTLQEVSEQGASSTIRLQFNNVNYATINEINAASNLNSVLTAGNTMTDKVITIDRTVASEGGSSSNFTGFEFTRNGSLKGRISHYLDPSVGDVISLYMNSVLTLESTEYTSINGVLYLNNIPSFASEAAAISAGLTNNRPFKIGTQLHIVTNA